MAGDATMMTEKANVGAGLGQSDGLRWKCQWRVEKFNAGAEDVRAGRYVSSTNGEDRRGQTVEPAEVIDREGNLLTFGGADVMWLGLRTGLSASTGLQNTLYNNANAAIRVGISNVAAAATQVDLQGATKSFAAMEATYPLHTTGTAASTSSKMLFRSLFSTLVGNHAWEEWGVVNRRSTTGGRLLNRKVEALGTKTAAATWTFTVTLSLA